jgi:hypothetical protein
VAIKKRKIKGYKGGGMDASKADFSSPSTNTANKGSDHSHSRFESGSGYYGEPDSNLACEWSDPLLAVFVDGELKSAFEASMPPPL